MTEMEDVLEGINNRLYDIEEQISEFGRQTSGNHTNQTRKRKKGLKN